MSVRNQARLETLKWLDEDKDPNGPPPPVGMHPLAIVEWNKGVQDGVDQYNEEEASWIRLENVIVYGLKLLIIAVVLTVAHIWGEGWTKVGGGLLGLYLIWKWVIGGSHG